ncbi:uncharacterized protein Z518_09418 [Rhinocladiella mackenziei CBS 650.93]|uniref:Rhinocladiella mackenziei CBS 650.93 unplaced genomic scaffold supercont1.7, whole genome shotgun sequence n=1 Tax=Rhinocladiella mackenziei CBS 650.93 TaxID=1442369 RepID=A0A0D2FI53_9EURO|nr:uncharacterized protein Z518_09418 [Rhinocladiella mackenziei CBS 650.93]KIX01692.1 hypothetical protein Z518_09418 [Rhinocladiella mackenziei CBS 650.93]
MSSSSKLSPGSHATAVNSLTIHYTVLASSPGLPPLIIHPAPWGCGAALYIQAFSRLSAQYALIIPSPRGNDSSQRPSSPDEMSSRHLVSDLEQFRQFLGLDKVSIVGHSSGGTIALGYAIAYPDHVDKLILLNTDLLGYERKDNSFFQDVGQIQARMSVTNDEEFKELVSQILPLYFAHPERGGPEAFKKVWTNVPSLWAYGAYYGADKSEDGAWDQVQELGKVKAKTLVVVGRQDRTCEIEISECVSRGVTGSRLVVLEDCGHIPWMEQEKPFWDLLEEFLKE